MTPHPPDERARITLFLCGDVMLGRGIDQLFSRANDPGLRERGVQDAREYVSFAEELHGEIPRPVGPAYVWGEALSVLEHAAPFARVINLETSVTTSDHFWPGKGIHYRLHPANLDCLRAARIDVCALANNHVLDFGREGLSETLRTLTTAGFQCCGAGGTLDEARAPARVALGRGASLLVFGMGTDSSGIAFDWAAGPRRSGVDLLPELSESVADEVAARISRVRRPGELTIASIHWGTNWGYDVPGEQIAFAHRLVDGGVDLVHGHSSHHPRPIELYRGHLILYGCGDFLSDYEGITGYEEFRGDLRPMYLVTLSPDGTLAALEVPVLKSHRLRLVAATPGEIRWLSATLSSASRPFGTLLLPIAGGLRLESAGH